MEATGATCHAEELSAIPEQIFPEHEEPLPRRMSPCRRNCSDRQWATDHAPNAPTSPGDLAVNGFGHCIVDDVYFFGHADAYA